MTRRVLLAEGVCMRGIRCTLGLTCDVPLEGFEAMAHQNSDRGLCGAEDVKNTTHPASLSLSRLVLFVCSDVGIERDWLFYNIHESCLIDTR